MQAKRWIRFGIVAALVALLLCVGLASCATGGDSANNANANDGASNGAATSSSNDNGNRNIAQDWGKDKDKQDQNGDGTVRVLCYGDSNTWGYTPGTGERFGENIRWTGLIGSFLGKGYSVVEAGLNGRTTAYDWPGNQTLNGLTALPGCLMENKPVDVVVLMLGTNDCSETLGLRPNQIAEGMDKLVTCVETICKETQGYVPEVVVVAPAPIVSSDGDTSAGEGDSANLTPAQKSRQLAALYQQVATAHGCKFYNSEAEVSKVDRIHLTEAGHSYLAMKLARVIAVS